MIRSKTIIPLSIGILLFLTLRVYSEQSQPKPVSVFDTEVPKRTLDIVMGRPTDKSIAISVISENTTGFWVEYGASATHRLHTPVQKLIAQEPKIIVLENLKPNTRYSYRVLIPKTGSSGSDKSDICYFHTRRALGAPFSFTITTDSHLDQNASSQTYATTLLNAATDSADFHLDLGDTFMTDKYRTNYQDAFAQYLAQRYYFGLVKSPVFLVLGNHDGEAGQRFNGRADNMTVWATQMRKRYFPNPEPNVFYSGNVESEPFVGAPQNYFAWEWGSALFIVLDPFRYTPREGADDLWCRTLGKKQYDWLKKTLESSRAKFKFVFIHNLVGGADLKGRARGGAEAAAFYEWGGKNPDGSDGFKAHRPDWDMPIHDLLVRNRVTAVFHGHDHLFAKQDLDGIVYQCLSQPGAKESGNTRQAEEYGYVSGKIRNEPGYMRVNVSPKSVRFEFIGTSISQLSKNKTLVYSYEIK